MGSSDVSKPTKGKKGLTIPSKIGTISTAASIPGVAALERRILYVRMHHYRRGRTCLRCSNGVGQTANW